MSRRSLYALLACCLFPSVALVGCDHSQACAPPKPPDVTVVQAVEREVTEFADFPGRTEATESVEIRARVSGYLDKVKYPEGGDVKVGDVLFEIDPKIFEADKEKAAGQVGVYEAKVKRLNGDVERNSPLVAKGTVSREDFEKIVGDRDEAVAGLKSAKANLDAAKINLDYARITAPISGKITRNLITVGNLVKADTTVLATIVSTKQMYVYFDIDENAYLDYRERVRQGEIKQDNSRSIPAEITLGDGTVIKGGMLTYLDVRLDRSTGTLQARATFPDPDALLKGGQFVRVRLPVGEPHKALVVPEIAVGSDQGLKYVYVVDDQNKVEYRRVTVGTVTNGMQIIKKGLKPGEWVIVKGLLRVRDGVTVTPKREEAAKPQ